MSGNGFGRPGPVLDGLGGFELVAGVLVAGVVDVVAGVVAVGVGATIVTSAWASLLVEVVVVSVPGVGITSGLVSVTSLGPGPM